MDLPFIKIPEDYKNTIKTTLKRYGLYSIGGITAFIFQSTVIYHISLGFLIVYMMRVGIFPYDFLDYWNTKSGLIFNAIFIWTLTTFSMVFFYPVYWIISKILRERNLSPEEIKETPQKKGFLYAWLMFGIFIIPPLLISRITQHVPFGELQIDLLILIGVIWAVFCASYIHGSGLDRTTTSLIVIFTIIPIYIANPASSNNLIDQVLQYSGLGGNIPIEIKFLQNTDNAQKQIKGKLILLGPTHIYMESNNAILVIPRANTISLSKEPLKFDQIK